jgi:hypothetical protein
VKKLHTSYNLTLGEGDNILALTEVSQLEVSSVITSNPREPLSLNAAINGPEKEKWIEAIKKEINNFSSRNEWEKDSGKDVESIQKRKLITTK